METTFKTPILFLIFNRSETTQKVFNQIKLIKPKFLYVAADGPRTNKMGEKQICEETRNIIKQIGWDCDLKTLYRDRNYGCRIAVSEAISWFFDAVDEGIILEDDVLPDLTFFRYCEILLERYRNDTRIYHINGTNFLSEKLPNDYYFSRYPIIWGWATWKRAWQSYDLNMKDFPIVKKLKSLNSILSTKDEQKHFYHSYQKMYINKFNTWDTQWMFTVMKNNGIAISPNTNLICNIGMDNDSTTHIFLKDRKRSPHDLHSINTELKIVDFYINTNADRITFENIWAKSISRIFRLVHENGILNILKYLFLKFKI